MTLDAGTRLGPYEILGLIGAGGMGEVYRASDPRIGREVAVKVLPAAFAKDPNRLRRFEQEVQAAGTLNHPNILVIHDVGSHNGIPYLVSELLEGETLRTRLNTGPLSQSKAIDYARQIAQGLAAAHDKEIVHRDLKPDNLFVTTDGRIKILDFGLAKFVQSEAIASQLPTVDDGTQPGAILGTVGYLSPEQVRGRSVDSRSDIFSLGVVLYEMLSGRRAFGRDNAADSLSAILKEDPPPLASPTLNRIVQHCLEKNSTERFQSARDFAFQIEAVSAIDSASAIGTLPAPSSSSRVPIFLAGAMVLVVVALGAVWLGRRLGTNTEKAVPIFKQLTFRRGTINSARFAPDGQTIVYGAAWEGKPLQLFSTRPESPESRSLGLPDADLLSISPSGEMAISLGRNFYGGWMSRGTLARAPLAGGAPREVLENVQEAAWASKDSRLAVVRSVEGKYRPNIRSVTSSLRHRDGSVIRGYHRKTTLSPSSNILS
jgi:serine/threonine protein kinase